MIACLITLLLVAADAVPADELRATVEVKIDGQPIAGAPILLQLTIKNTGANAFSYWCGGPARYPQGDAFTVLIEDEKGRWRRIRLSNGQYVQGSGGGIEIKPGDVVAFPAALSSLAAGAYSLRQVHCDAAGYYPGPDHHMVVTWPAMDAEPGLAINVREDAAALRRFGAQLLDRVRRDEPFARHVATEYHVQPVLDAVTEDLLAEDAGVVEGAAATLYHLSEFPKGFGEVVKRSMLKQLRADPPAKDACSMLAALAGRDGSDGSLDAVLAYVEAAKAWGEPRWPLQDLSDFKQPAAAAALRRALTDPDPLVRFTAAVGLSRRRDPAAVPVLVSELQRVGSGERVSAVYCLGEYWDDPRAMNAIEAASEDVNAEIRTPARQVLKDMQRREHPSTSPAK
jgi:hypothetical protein